MAAAGASTLISTLATVLSPCFLTSAIALAMVSLTWVWLTAAAALPRLSRAAATVVVTVVVFSETFICMGGVCLLPPDEPPLLPELFFTHCAYTVMESVTSVAAVKAVPLPLACVFQPMKV